MTDDRERLELHKILAAAAKYAVTEQGRERTLAIEPVSDLQEAKRRLDLTEEAGFLLFEIGVGGVEYFPPLGEKAEIAQRGGTLSCGELLEISRLFSSVRRLYTGVMNCADERIARMRTLVAPLVPREALEREITEKIVNESELRDSASERLQSIRREIKAAGERIKARLTEYLTGDERRYLQEGIVTVRGDRYVIPVKAEYKRSVRGFEHDRSATGATVFIEPEEIFEMNNALRSLQLDEKQEIARILSELSQKVGLLSEEIKRDEEVLSDADAVFACAEYAREIKGVKPVMNDRGIVDIIRGRHPLLDAKKAVPVSLSVGEECRFLVISGSNTGGKTVTLKMCGLFCLMAACGFFVPAAEGTRLSVFDGVYCDVGDSQSIEENLSTFSSHIVNLKNIIERANSRSLALADEPGGGTDPEEGQAIAAAVLSALVKKGCVGIVTTHYSALKEFAASTQGLKNGCMEFAVGRPLYRLKMGVAGASNALAVCKQLGMDEDVLKEAYQNLSEGARTYERTLRAAEESRVCAENEAAEAKKIKEEWQRRMNVLEGEEEKFRRERDKFLSSSKAEARRIVVERCARAEELLEEIQEIFDRQTVTEYDLIKARTLKNKMEQSVVEREELPARLVPVAIERVKTGDEVLVGSMNAVGRVLSVRRERGECEVQCGAIKVRVKAQDLFEAPKREQKGTDKVRVVQHLNERQTPVRECNVIGLTVSEALTEVEAFLDSALVTGMNEVVIVHGMGTGKLKSAIHAFLKRHGRVREFRSGRYGEGESGVTVVTLK